MRAAPGDPRFATPRFRGRHPRAGIVRTLAVSRGVVARQDCLPVPLLANARKSMKKARTPTGVGADRLGDLHEAPRSAFAAGL